VLLLILLTVLCGCTTKNVVCNKPYILVGEECCIDQNDNNICDRDETTNQALTTIATVKTSEKAVTTTTNVIVYPQEDKCSGILKSNLTYTEKETTLQECYFSKYIDYAFMKNDTRICDEMVDPYYMGECYASVASSLNDYTLCNGMQEITYEAKGFYNNLSNKDICFLSYVKKRLVFNSVFYENACEEIKNEQFKELCMAPKKAVKVPSTMVVYASETNYEIETYIILVTEDKYAISWDGELEIKIIEERGYGTDKTQTILYDKSRRVNREDFRTYSLGLLRTDTVLYRPEKIKLSDLSGKPSGNILLTEFTFTMKEGKVLKESANLLLS